LSSQGVVKHPALSRRGGCAEQVAPTRLASARGRHSFSNPFGTSLPQELIPARPLFQRTAKVLAQLTSLGTAGYLQRQLSSQLVHSEPQGACEALLNSRVQCRLRPSCNKQYKEAGLTGRTRKTCPKKSSTETTGVAISTSHCKSRLISLPISPIY
jgi:hypothetical protein